MQKLNIPTFFRILFHIPTFFQQLTFTQECLQQTKRELKVVEDTLSDVSRLLAECRAERNELRHTDSKVLPLLCTESLSAQERKALYELFQPKLDRYGWTLFLTAQKILGKFDEMHFYYEANRGRFEFMDGFHKLPYLLVQYEHLLGEQQFDRWRKVDSLFPAEECICTDIDKTTPEYIAFEETLYRTVCERIGLTFAQEALEKEMKYRKEPEGVREKADITCPLALISYSTGEIQAALQR